VLLFVYFVYAGRRAREGTVKQAGDVSKNIEIFEETVCMIPARGDVAEAAYVVLSLFNMRHKIYSFSRH
jgi:hypothetical protein